MAPVTFYGRTHFTATSTNYHFLPFRFMPLDGRMLLVNEVGEHLIIERAMFDRFTAHTLSRTQPEYADLKARHFLYDGNPETPIRLLATKYRTKRDFLREFTKLHILVVSLRCDHSCQYCQVSRVSPDRLRYDMSAETAERALDLVFRSPARHPKIEFQGGEPLLNFERIQQIVLSAEQRAAACDKHIEFVITTNLVYLTDEVLSFCRDHSVLLSTSLDGPAFIHNANRPRPDHNSYELTLAGIEKARAALGHDRISALMTTTRLSLQHPEAIVDEYIRQEFGTIVLRPLSPYGFAARSQRQTGYDPESFLAFYKRALAHILAMNRDGRFFVEGYAKLLLTKILTPFATGYVDLQSPAGAVINVAVYNYDGDVYATDESRMLAEMGDTTFRLGNVHRDTYAQMFDGELARTLATASCVESLPGCADCALQTYCGADPIENYATQGDIIGHRPTGAFCRRNMEIIKHLIHLYDASAETREIFHSWVTGAPRQQLLRQTDTNAFACAG